MRPRTRLDWLIETIPELREQPEWIHGSGAPWVAGKRLAMDVLVRSALERGDVIFSFHMYYYGGGDWWVATNLENYLRHVAAARPGDLIWVHSLDQLRARGNVLAQAEWSASQRSPVEALRGDALDAIAAYLRESRSHEVLLIWRSLDLACPAAGVCTLPDAEDLDDASLIEDLDARLADGAVRPGAVYAFREADLEDVERALLKAKRPNERGEVPIGGAY